MLGYVVLVCKFLFVTFVYTCDEPACTCLNWMKEFCNCFLFDDCLIELVFNEFERIFFVEISIQSFKFQVLMVSGFYLEEVPSVTGQSIIVEIYVDRGKKCFVQFVQFY